MPDLISLPRYVVSRGHPAIFFLDARLRGCVIIHNRVLRGTIFRAKALDYIDNSLILNNLFFFHRFGRLCGAGFQPCQGRLRHSLVGGDPGIQLIAVWIAQKLHFVSRLRGNDGGLSENASTLEIVRCRRVGTVNFATPVK